MPKSPIIPIKTYAPVTRASKISRLQTVDEQVRALAIELDRMKNDLGRAKDRIRRLREVVESEVAYWEKGLQSGEWEGIEALRRRLSRLKGALLYPGLAGWGKDEAL